MRLASQTTPAQETVSSINMKRVLQQPAREDFQPATASRPPNHRFARCCRCRLKYESYAMLEGDTSGRGAEHLDSLRGFVPEWRRHRSTLAGC